MTSEEYRQLILNSRKEQLTLTLENVTRLEKTFDTAIETLIAKIAALPVERQGTEWHRALFRLLSDTRAITEGLKKDYETLLNLGMVELAQNAASREAATAKLVNATTDASLFPDLERTLSLSSGLSINVTFGRLALQAVERAANRYYSDGLKLSDRLYKLSSSTKTLIEDTITQGLIHGTSAPELAKQLRTTLMEAGSKNPKSDALRIARTEIATSWREAHVLSTQTSPGVLKDYIEGLRWCLSAAHKQLDQCDLYATYDAGQGEGVYTPGDVPSSHPNCFCFLTTVLTNFPQSGISEMKPQPEGVPENQRRIFNEQYPVAV